MLGNQGLGIGAEIFLPLAWAAQYVATVQWRSTAQELPKSKST